MGTRKLQESAAISTLVYSHNRMKVYNLEEIEHCERSKKIMKYITAKKIQSHNTSVSHKTRLQAFSQFVFRKQERKEVDDLIEELQKGMHDPYELLTDFAGFLTSERISRLFVNVIRNAVKTTKKFLRLNKINVVNEDFKDPVPLPKKGRRSRAVRGRVLLDFVRLG